MTASSVLTRGRAYRYWRRSTSPWPERLERLRARGVGLAGIPALLMSRHRAHSCRRETRARRGIVSRRIGRACAAAAVMGAAMLGGAGSAPAATKWLCGPGVADDPCRPQLTTTRYEGFATRIGTVTAK